MQSAIKYSNIDEYIKTLPTNVQPILQEIRLAIKRTAPHDAVETISYQMPAFKLKGKNLVYFAAWKEHIGFYATPSGNEAFRKELSSYQTAKGSIKFPLNKPMPLELVKDIVKFRTQEILNKK